MTSARSGKGDLGAAGLLMRAEDFFALGETQERYELINGVVVMSPSPRPKHWKIIEELLMQLRQHAQQTGTPLDTFVETDLFIDDYTVYRPDLCAYARAPRAPLRLATPPELVVEVLSPGSKPLDLITKRDTYERFGVKEYWAIDPDDGRVRAWTLEDGRFRESLPGPDALPSSGLGGFVLNIAPLRKIVEM
jgi:Uma2 family endonuclease